MTVRYETLMLAIPEITNDESQTLEKQFERLVKKFEGSISSFDRWGKYLLAYPVRKNGYGIYFLVRFELNKAQTAQFMQELHALCIVKYQQFIMRYITNKLDADQPLTYQRPESLEDMPSQDIDTFLRENNMNGLLNKNGGERRARYPSPRAPKESSQPTNNQQKTEE